MRKGFPSKSSLHDASLIIGIAFLGIIATISPEAMLAITPDCLITHLTGFQHCWGCGMTHAIVDCLHGEFRAAWNTNALVYFVLPLLVFEYLRFCSTFLSHMY
jgi:hypothetical protein